MIHIAGGIVYNPKHGIVVVNQNNDSWSLPKGHIEQGEEPKDAAIREIWEESGITAEHLVFVAPIGFYERMRIKRDESDPDELRMITMYLFTTDTETLAPHDSENPEARWMTIPEALEHLTHPKDREFLEKNASAIARYVTRETDNAS